MKRGWEPLLRGHVEAFEDIARRYPPTTEDKWYFVMLVEKGMSLLDAVRQTNDGIAELAEKVGSCFADGTLELWPDAIGMDGQREIRVRWMRRRPS